MKLILTLQIPERGLRDPLESPDNTLRTATLAKAWPILDEYYPHPFSSIILRSCFINIILIKLFL